MLFELSKQGKFGNDNSIIKNLSKNEKGILDRDTYNGFTKLIKNILDEKLNPGLEFSKLIGNIYTGSLYLSLVSLIYYKN